MKSFSKTKWVTGFVVVAALAACGKSKLTEEQKAKVQRLAKSTSSGMSATLQAGNVGNGPGAGRARGRAVDGATDSRTAEMTAKIREGHCDFDILPKNIDKEISKVGSPTDIKPVSFKASGPTCPVFMEMKIAPQIAADQKSGSISFEILFEVKDEQLKKLSDVSKFSFKGDFSFSGDERGGRFKSSMTGELLSAEFGVVKLGLNGSADMTVSQGANGEAVPSGSANFEFTMKFKDFEFALEAKSDGKTMDLFLNGEKKTPQEVAEFFQGAAEELPPSVRPKRQGPGAFDPRQAELEPRAVYIPSVYDFFFF